VSREHSCLINTHEQAKGESRRINRRRCDEFQPRIQQQAIAKGEIAGELAGADDVTENEISRLKPPRRYSQHPLSLSSMQIDGQGIARQSCAENQISETAGMQHVQRMTR
jgi:hypothetical protein